MSKLYLISLLILTLAVPTVLQSCIKENLDDCPVEEVHAVRLVVVTHDDEALSCTRGTQTIENVYIYVFDDEYRYYKLWSGGAYTYGQPYQADIDLDPGTYQFVVWTNQGDTYNNALATYGFDDPADQMIVSFNYPSDGIVTYDLPDLHHGMLQDVRVVPNEENQFTITIKPDTYRLNFTVEGLTPDSNHYSFSITDNNSHYTYDNTIVEGMDEFTYLRTTTFTNGQLSASMNVLRLTGDRSLQFSFSNILTGEILYSDNLIAMIQNAYTGAGLLADFENIFEYDIQIRFGSSLLDVTISVNGWGYSGNETEL
ncbi:MAG: FimB/Mfa2 family fimbrial subunit [Bacteroides sp.]|nr:FimB/Mfa2 family fimbrial subunit [Bacteroides sp.]